MLTLYFARAAASFASHVALREAGLDFDLKEIDLSKGQQQSPDYLSVHPLGRVPALRLDSGAVLTENVAILGFVADSAPERRLLPAEAWPRAKAVEWMSLFASAVHPAFLGFFRPQRFGDSPAVHEALPPDSRGRFFDLLRHIERTLPDGGYVLGERFSVCDPYCAMFFMWARYFGFPVDTLPRYGALFARVSSRSAFQAAFAREGLDKLAAAADRARA